MALKKEIGMTSHQAMLQAPSTIQFYMHEGKRIIKAATDQDPSIDQLLRFAELCQEDFKLALEVAVESHTRDKGFNQEHQEA